MMLCSSVMGGSLLRAIYGPLAFTFATTVLLLLQLQQQQLLLQGGP